MMQIIYFYKGAAKTKWIYNVNTCKMVYCKSLECVVTTSVSCINQCIVEQFHLHSWLLLEQVRFTVKLKITSQVFWHWSCKAFSTVSILHRVAYLLQLNLQTHVLVGLSPQFTLAFTVSVVYSVSYKTIYNCTHHHIIWCIFNALKSLFRGAIFLKGFKKKNKFI